MTFSKFLVKIKDAAKATSKNHIFFIILALKGFVTTVFSKLS